MPDCNRLSCPSLPQSSHEAHTFSQFALVLITDIHSFRSFSEAACRIYEFVGVKTVKAHRRCFFFLFSFVSAQKPILILALCQTRLEQHFYFWAGNHVRSRQVDHLHLPFPRIFVHMEIRSG